MKTDDEEIPKLSWDHQHFLIDGKPFYPSLEEGGNTILVDLPCQPHADLSWSVPSTSKKILWNFDFGLDRPFFPLTDDLHFQALLAACKHFSQTIWPKYQDQSLGGILYRGSADFSMNFLWNDWQKENQKGWQTLHPRSHPHLFCADAFSSYFQLLAHQLPDELPLVLCLDARSLPSPARSLNLLSRERFEHFILAVRAEKWLQPTYHWDEKTFSLRPLDASIGLCLPKDESMTEDLFFEFDKMIDQLYESNQPFRVVLEEFLTEQWEHLEEIHVLSDSLSPQGIRKLKGFEAAGGVVKERVRGRGI